MSTTINSALAWRNWLFDSDSSVTPDSGTWETEAPLSSLQTPQLGDVAIAVGLGTNEFNFNLGGTQFRPVHVIGILNTNVIEIAEDSSSSEFGIVIELTDSSANTDTITIPPQVLPSATNDFQTHLFWFVPATGLAVDRERITVLRITVNRSGGLICGTRDPYSGALSTSDPFQAGAIWAGPLWIPPRGIKLRSPVGSVLEERRGVTSIGRQRYPSVEPRVRSLRFEMNLPESSVYSIDIEQPSAQQMAAWCGLSRPLLLFPQRQDADLLYLTGFYGYLDEPVAWSTIDKGTEREYIASVQVTEGL